MKKIKVIFPDGSEADIDESELDAAIQAGAKRADASNKSKKISVSFPDGSTADIEEKDIDSAMSAGAVKKKIKASHYYTTGKKIFLSLPYSHEKIIQMVL